MSEARRGHDSFVDALVVHLDRALDGMLSTARQLGDELVNAPTGLPGGNTAYQLVCHCCGVLEFWGGRVIADRSIERDREAEFCARGTVAELEALVAGQRSKFALDTRQLDGAADPRGPLRERDLDRDELRTQAGILLHVYEELAHLLDANVLIALTTLEHEHHDTAAQWFTDIEGFALCPVVEGALLRFGLWLGETSATGKAVIAELRSHPKFRFWSDDISFSEVDLSDVQGHRQVTDVYLAALAAAHGGVLATFDREIAALRPSQTVTIDSF